MSIQGRVQSKKHEKFGAHCSSILGQDGKPLLQCPEDWTGIAVERKVVPDVADCGAQYTGEPVIVFPISGGGYRWYRSGSITHEVFSELPNFLIYGKNYERDHGRWEGLSGESITLTLPISVIRRHLLDDVICNDLVTRYYNRDDTLRGLVIALANELQHGFFNGRLYAEGLSISIIGLLINRYGTINTSVEVSCDQLSSQQLARVKDYIFGKLGENISIESMANELAMSSTSFHRKFRNSFGVAPHRYVMAERIRFAKKLMRQKHKLSFADIALFSGFSSQAHFSSMFKRVCGLTPSAWIKNNS
ncbi:hypothetical protein C4K68_28205 [Pokkaliibacter plantistimulans]|uniref:HTH araC/xylS-type domain-containing protein n=1 Tax=Proteobacteria bacterium 228 TaxID=2083153 RepID=A0A2S5KHD6_9PROT|nr:AraC family transcriptional regulator [Pokkaliibacter plantistimulans]PPC74003.1 hypothetical protein C4K68_28205 [Pokkaliibacter plantistimulans]